MSQTRKTDPEKVCPICGKKMERRYYGTRLEDLGAFKRRKYCSRSCMAKGQFKADMAGISAARKRSKPFLKFQCEMCGTTENLQAHHKDMNPYNNRAENIMTLCGKCHTKLHWILGKTIPKRSA